MSSGQESPATLSHEEESVFDKQLCGGESSGEAQAANFPSPGLLVFPLPSVQSVKNDAVLMRELDRRVNHLEKNANSNAYNVKGFKKESPNEGVWKFTLRFFREVMGLEEVESKILNAVYAGMDKDGSPVVRITLIRSFQEQVNVLLQGFGSPLQKYNKDHGCQVRFGRPLTGDEKITRKEAQDYAKLLRIKLGNATMVTVSHMNFKIRVGSKGGKWRNLIELRKEYGDLTPGTSVNKDVRKENPTTEAAVRTVGVKRPNVEDIQGNGKRMNVA